MQLDQNGRRERKQQNLGTGRCVIGASLDSIWNEVQKINDKLDELPGIIEINGNQVHVVSLDELSESLGLIMAGEFRAGNRQVPGDTFSGIRIGYPGFAYPEGSTASSDMYNIAGVDADTLMFGLRATDGVAIFGGGAALMDVDGMRLQADTAVGGGGNNTSRLRWYLDILADDPDADPLGQIAVAADSIELRLTHYVQPLKTADSAGGNESSDITATIRLQAQSFDDGSAMLDVNDSYGVMIHNNDSTGAAWLGFAAMAATDVIAPDTEVLRLWVDTAGELRMTDSGGVDWYITKNNDTGST